MFEKLKERVCQANLMLPKHGLVVFTWGNVSEIDREHNVIAIKPSGVDYEGMHPDQMVLVNLDGTIVEGNLKPSSDLATHLELYRNFKDIGGIVHTHSRYATSFAQAGKDIVALGTTHGDYFYGDIPCTDYMAEETIKHDYELNTGKIIIDTFKERKIDPNQVPACLVHSHGPFVWGTDCFNAVHNSVVLEELAFMALHSQLINPDVKRMQQTLLDKHFLRKHGPGAYYGQ